MAKADLSADYAIGAYLQDPDLYAEKWDQAALSWREREHAIGRARLNIAYADHPRQALDLFLPQGRPRGLLVFIHGGYWKAFDRKSWSHFAAGATLADWAFAIPSYRLAPEVRIADITQDVAQAITKAASLTPGDILIAGHSAGGHLCARMATAGSGLPADVAARIARIAPISPVADLRPLLQADLGQELRLDAAQAQAESPILAENRLGVPTHVWVGAEERAAFLDQATRLATAWPEAQLHMAAGQNHFDILNQLLDADSPMLRRFLPD